MTENLANFPGLEQAYWTIVWQYTSSTENNLRKDKSEMWCWIQVIHFIIILFSDES